MATVIPNFDATTFPCRTGILALRWQDLPNPAAGAPKIREIRDGWDGGFDFLTSRGMDVDHL